MREHTVHSAKLIKITFARYQTYLNFAKGKEAYLFEGAAEDGGLFFLADVTLPSASVSLPSSCFSFAFFVLYFLVSFCSFASLCVSRSPLCCSSPRVVSSCSGLSLWPLFPFFCFRLSSVYILVLWFFSSSVCVLFVFCDFSQLPKKTPLFVLSSSGFFVFFSRLSPVQCGRPPLFLVFSLNVLSYTMHIWRCIV